MKRSFRKIISLGLCVICLTCLLAGCGGGSVSTAAPMQAMSDSAAMNNGIMGISKDYGDVEMAEEMKAEGDTATNSDLENRKIIERVYLDIQTKTFEELVDAISERVSEFGGYMEHSSISGNGFREEGNRYADLTVRIPADEADAFVNFVSESSAILNKEVTTEDVTLSYVDMESRLHALKLQKEALEKLLEEASSTQDIAMLYQELTDVIYNMESIESQLRTYDNLIDYTTISLSIYEVERTVVVEKQTVWQRIGTDFTNNLQDLGEEITDSFVYIVGNLPYILFYGAIIALIVFAAKRVSEKQKALKNKAAEKADAEINEAE